MLYFCRAELTLFYPLGMVVYMRNTLEQQLIALGLQENEVRVYLALLELGEGSVTAIAGRAKLNRTTAYDILERLGLYGIVGRVASSKKKRIYTPEPPHKLRQYLENKKHAYERRLKELKDVLPELQMLYKTELKPSVKFAEGKEDMTKLYGNVLESKTPVYSILNLKGYAESFDEVGADQSKERAKRGIEQKVLALKSKEAEAWHKKTYDGKKRMNQATEYKWLGWDDRYNTAGEINIFDDKVIGMLTKPDENVAFEIKSQTFSDLLKIVFEIAWEKTK